jgi:hypothetical protein
MLAGGAAASGATVFASHERVAVDFTITSFLACENPEPVAFHGYIQMVDQNVFTPDGGSHGAFNHFVLEASGVGLITSNRYVLTQASYVADQSPSGGFREFTNTDNIHFITQGATNNRLVKVVFHTTVDANGNPTAEISDFRIECVG